MFWYTLIKTSELAVMKIMLDIYKNCDIVVTDNEK